MDKVALFHQTANSVDPDQTGPLCLYCLLKPVSPKTLKHYYTIVNF